MASHQILKFLWWVEFSQRVADAGLQLVDGDSWVEWRAVRGGTMCPLRGSEVAPLTTVPPLKFVFSWGATLSCVPVIIRASAPPLPQTRLSLYTVCVCVSFYQKSLYIYLLVTLFYWNWSAYNWESDSGWPELISCVLFGIKEEQEQWQTKCPGLFYLDYPYYLL